MRLMRIETRPRPHDFKLKVAFELDDANIDSTLIPLLMYDEGLGAPDTYNSHPEHASYVTSAGPNCFVNSRVDSINCLLEYSLTSKAIDDNIPGVRVSYMVVSSAFSENLDAKDELSGLQIKNILEVQTESTDRQTYPLWAVNKMALPYTGSATLDAAVPGLTASQIIEAVNFGEEAHYDAIQFYSISGLYKTLQHGLKWLTLTPNRPFARIPIHIKSNVKRMNEYAILGLMLHVPVVDTNSQMVHTSDITAATQYVNARVVMRADEWNLGFDHEKV